MCLCAVALAAPQGYNYNSQGVGAGVALQQQVTSFGSNFGAGPAVVSSSSSGGFFQGQQAHAIQQSFGGQQQTFGGHQQQQQQPQAIVSKRFFIHSAPEDAEEDVKEKHITVGVPKKNYNVVFIKSPAKSNKKTAIKISPAPTEEKTVIYVLSKKTDASDVQAEVVEHATTTAKPEVFFIKYKTNEEAAHAQEQIQAQYDALGGSSQVSDEGVAPVTSVIGALGGNGADVGTGAGASAAAIGAGQSAGASYTGVSVGHGGQTNNNAYLPPNFY